MSGQINRRSLKHEQKNIECSESMLLVMITVCIYHRFGI